MFKRCVSSSFNILQIGTRPTEPLAGGSLKLLQRRCPIFDSINHVFPLTLIHYFLISMAPAEGCQFTLLSFTGRVSVVDGTNRWAETEPRSHSREQYEGHIFPVNF